MIIEKIRSKANLGGLHKIRVAPSENADTPKYRPWKDQKIIDQCLICTKEKCKGDCKLW